MTSFGLNLENLKSDPAYEGLYATFAVGSQPVVAVVGSGLSMPAGLPTWPGLKKHLVDVLKRKAAGFDADESRAQLAKATKIEQTENYWLAFEMLQKALRTTTYRAEVRNALSPADTADIPAAYTTLWRTPIRGVLTVNLDSLARRAFSAAYPGGDLKAFLGRDASRLTSLLHGPHRFLYNLHGVSDDAESWVFTKPDLDDLLANGNYQALLRAIFSTYTVLLVGVSADDIAVGGPLEKLSQMRIQGPTHYWMTDRNDTKTDRWAESVGIRVIKYSSREGHGVVEQALDAFASARVEDKIILEPVLSSSGKLPVALIPPDELVTHPTEEVRQVLNDHAASLLKQDGGLQKFADFLAEYDEAVHRAWYSTSKPPKNLLFGNTLIEEIARGAFGRVFRAKNAAGDEVAVKVLLTELRSEIELLHSFRRGVEAMRILERRNVPGMVAYRDASEVPAFVTMDWVEGPNLATAKASGYLTDWNVVLWVARELSKVLKSAHELPERVLHRDVRPANVMLRNGWSPDYEDWQLVVLDFDLSTYRGAREKSVLSEGSALGFLAPEQLDSRSKFSTRNAGVDSFGLGMTLLFLCSGEEPEAYSQRRGDYRDVVRSATRILESASWISLPRRIERLILCATADMQSSRWDMSQIVRELDRLYQAQNSPESVKDLDLLAEELIARTRMGVAYEWSIDKEQANFSRGDGLTLALDGPASAEDCTLRIEWASTGNEARGSLTKYLPEKLQRASSALRSSGWRRVVNRRERHSFILEASLPYLILSKEIDSVSRGLDSALSELKFSDF